MLNKKRIAIFVVFLCCLFFMTTFAGGTAQNTVIATRLVTFVDGYNNSTISEQTIEVGTDAEVPNDPSHQNLVFAGWYRYDAQDERVTDFTNILENLRVIAKYASDLNGNGIADDDETRYTITFRDSFDGSILGTEQVLPGMSATAPMVPAHAGRTFVGWNGAYTNVTRNATVDTVYTVDEIENPEQPGNVVEETFYTVTFIDDDTDEVISTVRVREGLTAPTPNIPTHENRVFDRYVGDYSNITSDRIIRVLFTDDLNNDGIRDDIQTHYTVEFTLLPYLKGGIRGTFQEGATLKYENIVKGAKFSQVGIIVPKLVPESDLYYSVWKQVTQDSVVDWESTEDMTIDSNLTFAAMFIPTNDQNKNGIADEDPTDRYTLTFITDGNGLLNDGKTEVVLDGLYDEENPVVTLPTIQPNEGYEFAYLEKQEQEGWTKVEVADHKITLNEKTATYRIVFKKQQFEVVFVYKNGTGSEKRESQMITYGESAQVPSLQTVVTKDKTYTFTGWDTEESVYMTVKKPLVITANYAESLTKYTVTFKFKNEKGEEIEDIQTVEYGKSAQEPHLESKIVTQDKTYFLTGWDQEETTYHEVTQSVIVTAQYSVAPTTYFVTFNYKDENGKDKVSKQVINYNTSANKPEIPTEIKTVDKIYTFTGWDTSATMYTKVTKDLVITAQYDITPRKYNVTFIYKDETGIKEEKQQVEYGKSPIIPNPQTVETVDKIYTFTGWDKNATEYIAVRKDVVVTAQYSEELRKYTVVFHYKDENGKDQVSEQKINYNESASKPEIPTEIKTVDKIYTFTGWDTPATAYIKVTKDLVITAQYQELPREYTVTFEYMHGTGLVSKHSQTVVYKEKAIVPTIESEVFTEDFAYIFEGWDTDASLYESVTNNITVKAVYQKVPAKNTLTIYYVEKDHHENVLQAETKYTYLYKQTYHETLPEQIGNYKLVGNKTVEGTMGTEAVEVYAEYELSRKSFTMEAKLKENEVLKFLKDETVSEETLKEKIVVAIIDEEGNRTEIDDYTITGFHANETGTYEITITYHGEEILTTTLPYEIYEEPVITTNIVGIVAELKEANTALQFPIGTSSDEVKKHINVYTVDENGNRTLLKEHEYEIKHFDSSVESSDKELTIWYHTTGKPFTTELPYVISKNATNTSKFVVTYKEQDKTYIETTTPKCTTGNCNNPATEDAKIVTTDYTFITIAETYLEHGIWYVDKNIKPDVKLYYTDGSVEQLELSDMVSYKTWNDAWIEPLRLARRTRYAWTMDGVDVYYPVDILYGKAEGVTMDKLVFAYKYDYQIDHIITFKYNQATKEFEPVSDVLA